MSSQPSSGSSEWPQAEELAAQYLDRLAAGVQPRRDEYLRQLPAGAQQAFLEILRFAETVESYLPTVIEAGQRLGPYELREEIGKGGMGRVFRAHDTHLERDVALKILPPHLGEDPQFRQRFEEEPRFLARLQHPHIVGVHDSGSNGEVQYLVMDLVPGISLHDLVTGLHARPSPWSAQDLEAVIGRPPQEGRTSLLQGSYEQCAARIVRAVTGAIEAAHSQGILHRDLKPNNVMVGGGGQPVVLDFGLASRGESFDAEGDGLYGAVPYLAPEQLESKRVGADVRSDVYQLGLLLYELLTGRRAFPGDRMNEVMEQVQRGQFRWPRQLQPRLSRDLEAICLKALARQPADRYATARELGEDLERFLRDEPTRARPPGLMRRLRDQVRRHRVAFAIAATLIVALSLASSLGAGDEPRIEVLHAAAADAAVPVWHRVAGEKVRPGEAIAVEIELAEPAVVYAALEQDKIIPVRFGESTGEPGDVPLDLALSAGTHRVLLGEIDDSADQLGVWIWVASGPMEEMEVWLDGLEQRPTTSEGAYDQLRSQLAFRGRSPTSRHRMDAEQRRLLTRSLQAPSAPDEWPIQDPSLTRRYFPVLSR